MILFYENNKLHLISDSIHLRKVLKTITLDIYIYIEVSLRCCNYDGAQPTQHYNVRMSKRSGRCPVSSYNVYLESTYSDCIISCANG